MMIHACFLTIVLVSCTVTPAAACVAPLQPSPDITQTKPSESSQGKPRVSRDSQSKKKGILHLRGTLVEGGAECQRFRASNNKFYTLTGDLRGFRTGDAVEITGKIPRASHCMQDTPIQVQTIRRVSPQWSNDRKAKKPAAPN